MLKFNVPVVDHAYNSQKFAVRHYFQGAYPERFKTRALLMNFVRLVDLSIYCYGRGSELLKGFAAASDPMHPNLWPHIQAAYYFEFCIDKLLQALKFLRAIKKDRDAPKTLQTKMRRDLGVLKSESRIREFRNCLQHLESDVISGKIAYNQPVALYPQEDNIEVASYSISYSDLASWLRELSRISTLITED